VAATVGRSDLAIHQDAVSELDWDARFDPGELGVEVDDGVVTLRGTVSSYAKLRAAAGLVARIPGVRAVVNDLAVRTGGSDDDVALASRVRMALEMDADVPNERIDCIVRKGHATLRGSVDHAYQREAAELAVAHVEGVRGVDVQVDIRGDTRADAAIGHDLREALDRRVARANDVTCHVQGATVTLAGRVPRLADRMAAEGTAWRTRGVRHVIDRIVVTGS
jgi:osmotically-inducible protein OsmY